MDVKKEDGFSALHLAALNNHRDVAEILIKEVSKAAAVRLSPLHFFKTSKRFLRRDAATSTSGTTATRRRCSWQWRRATPTWCSCWWQRAPTSTWRTRMATPPCTWPSYARSWPAWCSAPPWEAAAPKTAARDVPPRRCTAGWELMGVWGHASCFQLTAFKWITVWLFNVILKQSPENVTERLRKRRQSTTNKGQKAHYVTYLKKCKHRLCGG